LILQVQNALQAKKQISNIATQYIKKAHHESNFTTIKKILVVEDDPVSLMMLSKLAERWGFKVTTAEDGEMALAC
jgi:PleD family two-component response regulator